MNARCNAAPTKEVRMNARLLYRRVFVMLAEVLLSACGNRLSLDNYNKLKVGQTYDEVKQVVGDPARCDEAFGIRACSWGDEQRGIEVSFVSDKVLLMSAKNLK